MASFINSHIAYRLLCSSLYQVEKRWFLVNLVENKEAKRLMMRNLGSSQLNLNYRM